MKIQLKKINDAFAVGGYLDTQNMEYIAPKWLHDTNPKFYKRLTAEQFERIWNGAPRYLKLPTLRPAALRCSIALQLGLSEEELAQAGINPDIAKTVIWDDDQDIDTSCPNFTEKEFEMLGITSWALAKVGKLVEAMRLDDVFFEDTMREWLAERGIELVDSEQA